MSCSCSKHRTMNVEKKIKEEDSLSKEVQAMVASENEKYKHIVSNKNEQRSVRFDCFNQRYETERNTKAAIGL